MLHDKDKIAQLDAIFYARSIAVAGASRNESKMGSLWLKGIRAAGFKGDLYGLNPSGGEVFGMPIYPNLEAIPGPVDLVISCIPRTGVLDLLDDCAAKGIKGIEFFTAGFRETAEPHWIEVEKEMARRARRSGFRIIGPNCIGISCPEHAIPYGGSTWLPAAGSIGYVSQSGGHVGKMLEIGTTRGLAFSKCASMGNGCDLGGADFLEYFAADPKTQIIAMYLEGPTDARLLLDNIRKANSRKPVVVWKGGRTEAGARATAGHTGALAASPLVWSGALAQAGAIECQGLDEQADVLLLLQQFGRLERANVGIICGITDGGGGEAVLSADACASEGITVPPLSKDTHARMLDILGQVGSVLVNPIDVSQRPGDIGALLNVIESLASTPYLDVLVIYENMDILIRFLGTAMAMELNQAVIKKCKTLSKPVLVVLPPGGLEPDRLEAESQFVAAGIPVYPSMDRAARAIASVTRYYERGNKP